MILVQSNWKGRPFLLLCVPAIWWMTDERPAMIISFKALLAGVAVALLLCVSAAIAQAEDPEHPVPAPEGFMTPTLEGPWRSRIALQGWLPTTIKACVDSGSDSGCDTEDLGWLLDNVGWMIPIDIEVRKGSFGAFVHTLGFKLEGTLNAGPAQVDWTDEGVLIDTGLSYELGHWALGGGARAPSLTVEGFAGARLLYDPVDITIDLGPVKGSETDSFSNYVPIFGLRTFWDLTEHWNLRIEGDYGGFGVDDNHETWQALGLLGYRFRGWGVGWNIQAGYRAMRLFDLRRNGYDVQVDLRGPTFIIAAEF
jgi:hypothetical protein